MLLFPLDKLIVYPFPISLRCIDNIDNLLGALNRPGLHDLLDQLAFLVWHHAFVVGVAGPRSLNLCPLIRPIPFFPRSMTPILRRHLRLKVIVVYSYILSQTAVVDLEIGIGIILFRKCAPKRAPLLVDLLEVEGRTFIFVLKLLLILLL